jgi:hypothetical protein
MTGVKCFGILIEVEGEGGAQGALIADIAVIARHPTPESQKRAFRGPRSSPRSERQDLAGINFLSHGCTSNPTPIWDDLGCGGMNGEGGGRDRLHRRNCQK